MIDKKVIQKAVESYWIHIQMSSDKIEKSQIEAVRRRKEYLENGGDVTAEWLCENCFIFVKIFDYRHKELDREIKDIIYSNSEDELTLLRNERVEIVKYKSLLNKFLKKVE